MAATGLNVGSISALLGARFDDREFDLWRRAIVAARQEAGRPIDSELGANLTDAEFRRYEQLIQEANGQDATAELGADVQQQGFRQYESEISDAQGAADSGVRAQLSATVDESGFRGFTARISQMTGPVGVAAAALGAVFVKGFVDAVDAEAVDDKLQAQLDLSDKDAARFGKVRGRLYAGAYGESMEEVSEAIGGVVSSLKGFRRESDEAIEAASATALNFAATFDVEVSRSVQVVGQLVRRGLAKDVDEGFDLITAGFNRVPAMVREDLLDAVDEYGKNFAALGYTGEETFGILVKAAEDGMYGIDKTGDAVKEMSILLGEMGDPAKKALGDLRLDAGEVQQAFLKGGDAANEATDDIVKALRKVEDPAKQTALAIALFGDPLNEIGTADLEKLLKTLDNGKGSVKGFEDAADRMGKNLSSNFKTDVEIAKRSMSGFATSIGDNVLVGAKRGLDGIKRFGRGIGDPIKDGLRSLTRDSRGELGRFGRTWDDVKDYVSRAIRGVKNAVKSVFGGENSADVREFGRAVRSALGVALDVIGRFSRFALRVAKDTLPALGQSFRGFLTVLRGVMKIITGILTGDWGKVWDGVKDIAKGAVKQLGAIVRAAVSPIGSAIGAIADAGGRKLADGWNRALRGAAGFVNDVIDILNKIPGVNIGHVSWGSGNRGEKVTNNTGTDSSRGKGGTRLSRAEIASARPAAASLAATQEFADGGEVIKVSSGEAMRYPDGSWAIVPGQRVAADNVITWAPYDTEVYTEDGIRRLAGGATRQEALRDQLRHFAGGGVLDKLRAGVQSAASTAAGAVESAADFAGDTVKGLVGGLPKLPGGLLRPALSYAKDKAAEYIKSKASSLLGGGGLGDNNPRFEALNALASDYGNVITSGYRPGDDGWHGQNRARDYAGGDMMGLAKAIVSKYGSKMLEVIYTPLGFGIKNGRRISSFGADVDADHYDHVHAAFGSGGISKKRLASAKKAGVTVGALKQYDRALAAAKRVGTFEDFDPIEMVKATEPLKLAREKAAKAAKAAKGKGSGSNVRAGSDSEILEIAKQSRASKQPSTWIRNALRITGLNTPANYAAAFGRMMQESTGNPRAINLWDSNAKKGTPSKGLLQTIQPTFDKYKLPILGNNIYDVAANPVAALRYMIGEYGHVVGRSGTGYHDGGVVRAFRGGGVLGRAAIKAAASAKKTLSKVTANEGVARSVARSEKGVEGFEKKIQKLETDYTLTDREFSVRPLELVTENPDGTTTVNQDAISARVGQLDKLKAKRQKIIDTIGEYRKAVSELIETLKRSIQRLKNAIKATAGKSRKKVRDGYREQIGVYEARIGELREVNSDLQDDERSNYIDLHELDREKDEVRGEKGSGSSADSSTAEAGSGDGSADAPETPTFDSSLTDEERKEAAAVDKDTALAKLTPNDPTDDEAARKRGETLYRGILSRLQSSGASDEVITAAASQLAGYLPDSSTSPDQTAADLAAAVEQQLQSFFEARSNILTQLGSNVADYGAPDSLIGGGSAGSLRATAGGTGYGYQGTARTGAQVVVEKIVQNYPQAPENPDAWKARVGFSTSALLPA